MFDNQLRGYETLKSKGEEALSIQSFDEALLYFEKALEDQPESPEAFNNIGKACFYLGDLDRAEEYSYQAIERDSNYWQAYHNLGKISHKRGLYQQALTHYEKAIEMSQGDYIVHLNLAILYSDLRLHENARDHYDIVLNLKPEEFSGLLYKAQNLIALGQYDEGIAIFTKLLGSAPQDQVVNIQYLLAEVYLHKKEYEEALSHFNKVLEISPEYALGYEKLAYIYYKTGQYTLALEYYRKAASFQADSGFSELGSKELEAFYKVLPKDDEDMQSEFYTQVIQYFQQSLANYPQPEDIHFYLGRIFNLRREFKQAIYHLTQSIEINPNSSNVKDYYFNLGTAYGMLEQWQEALDSLKKYVLLNPNDKLGLSLIATVYEKQGENKLAEQYFKQIKEFN